MRILISNDDGINAPGIAALCLAVQDMGELFVAAPDTQQSAASHTITLAKPVAVRKVKLGPENCFEGFSISGRPADCVRLAIRKLMPEPPDLVLTGLNAGANVGINVFYSGTVAAAAEAAMLGIPAVAFSKEGGGETVEDFAFAARTSRFVLDQLLADGLSEGDLLNVNIPDVPEGKLAGICAVPQSTAGIEDMYHLKEDSTEGQSYQLGDHYAFASFEANTDVARQAEGYVTVTPLHVDMTNHDRLAVLAHKKWEVG